MEEYIVKNGRRLRCGYTSGSCAAAAAKAASRMLLEQKSLDEIEIMTPKGVKLNLEVIHGIFDANTASCAIRKESGDDPDVTNGILIYARVEKTREKGVTIEGGPGVGRVTKKGLEQPIGEAAINKVPRKMILEAAEEVLEEQEYAGGLGITIFIPEGAAIAKKTFNERLGIQGGISVLGTSGIVEPMSEDAIRETIHLEIKVRKAEGRQVLLAAPGNYGEEFARKLLKLPDGQWVKCSNYIGELMDYAVLEGMEQILLTGHMGKMVKVAAGVMNTHSRYGDGRMEILAAHTAAAGGDTGLILKIMNSNTTEEALNEIRESGLLEPTVERILMRIGYYLNERAKHRLKIGVILFSNQLGLLGKNQEAEEMLWYIS